MKYTEKAHKDLYKAIKNGELSAEQVRQHYIRSQYAQNYLSTILLNNSTWNRKLVEIGGDYILHLSKYDCLRKERKFLKSFVLCTKGDKIIEHKVGKCPHYSLED